ncbi:hypothetical protein ACEQ8H_008913 [Pleosporales sp. CAS-2024a]
MHYDKLLRLALVPSIVFSLVALVSVALTTHYWILGDWIVPRAVHVATQNFNERTQTYQYDDIMVWFLEGETNATIASGCLCLGAAIMALIACRTLRKPGMDTQLAAGKRRFWVIAVTATSAAGALAALVSLALHFTHRGNDGFGCHSKTWQVTGKRDTNKYCTREMAACNFLPKHLKGADLRNADIACNEAVVVKWLQIILSVNALIVLAIFSAQARIRRATRDRDNIVHGIDHGSITAQQLVHVYKTRTSEINHIFHAITEFNPDAYLHARALDVERRSTGKRGPLHGIPILLKDNMPTLDGTDTTCGSKALVGARPMQEAAVVSALRKSGAVILGKANMAEWSGFRSTSGCSGWSACGGQATGIFYPGMKASGSSSGSAIAVAQGLCFAALGTETCYSIVSPAEKSGIIGFKPTRSLISSEGIIYASQRLDTVGLLTRNVVDAMYILLEIIAHSDHHAPRSKLSLGDDIGRSCSTLDLTGVHIGIPWHLQDVEKNLQRAKWQSFQILLAALSQAGATLVHDVHIAGAEEYEAFTDDEKQVVLATDMKLAINTYLGSLRTNPHNIHNLQRLIAFTKTCPDEEYPARNVTGLERAQATTNATDAKYRAMLARDDHFADQGGIPGALDRHACHVLLVPTLSVTMQMFAAKAGSPVMSVPMGSYPAGTPVETDPNNGLVNIAPGIPFSVFIYGRARRDDTVLNVGHVVEKAMGVRSTLVPYLEPVTDMAHVPVVAVESEEARVVGK